MNEHDFMIWLSGILDTHCSLDSQTVLIVEKELRTTMENAENAQNSTDAEKSGVLPVIKNVVVPNSSAVNRSRGGCITD